MPQRMTVTVDRLSGRIKGGNIGMSNKEETNICPVCGYVRYGHMDICPVCGWQNGAEELRHPDRDERADNVRLDEAEKSLDKGKKIN